MKTAVNRTHLRFGPNPIHSTYLVSKANFVACHQWLFLERYDMLSALVDGGTFLLNSPFGTDEVWDKLPRLMQQQLGKCSQIVHVFSSVAFVPPGMRPRSIVLLRPRQRIGCRNAGPVASLRV